MLTALRALEIAHAAEAFAIEVIDVDADEDLVAQYDEWVPVLIASKDGRPARQLCHYFLDEVVVRAFIADA